MDTGGTTRRDMLKKSAAAGAIVWAVPTLTASPAFAAGSISTNLCEGNAKPNSVTYEFVGGDNTFSVCTETGPGQPTNPIVTSTGGPSDTWTHAVVTAVRLTGGGGGNQVLDVNGASSAIVPKGGQFTLDGAPLDPNARVTLKQSDAAGNLLGGEQIVTYHFSCSQPLCFGDKHGPLEVVSYTVS